MGGRGQGRGEGGEPAGLWGRRLGIPGGGLSAGRGRRLWAGRVAPTCELCGCRHREAAVSGAPGGGRHAEGTHRADTVINCWPYFLRTLEAGCLCTRPLARVRALPPRPPPPCSVGSGWPCVTSNCSGLRGEKLSNSRESVAAPPLPSRRGRGLVTGESCGLGASAQSSSPAQVTPWGGQGVERRLGGSGLCRGWTGLWTSLSPTPGLGFPSFTTGPTISGFLHGRGGWWTNPPLKD